MIERRTSFKNLSVQHWNRYFELYSRQWHQPLSVPSSQKVTVPCCVGESSFVSSLSSTELKIKPNRLLFVSFNKDAATSCSNPGVAPAVVRLSREYKSDIYSFILSPLAGGASELYFELILVFPTNSELLEFILVLFPTRYA